MSKYYSNQDFRGQGEPSRNKKNRIWLKALKICGWILGCLVVLCGIALWIIAYHVSPERIIKIIEKESSRYLMADIKIGNLDYKFFRSYPWLEFEADSLIVISKSLDNVSGDIKQELPLYADSLIFVEKIKGKINVAKLLHKDIKIKSLEINRPEINLVTVNDSIANFNIATHIAAPKKLPDIDVSEIKMEGPVALRYFSLQPELETDISIESLDLLKEEKRKYTIGFEGMIAGRYQQISLPGKVPVKFKASVEPHLPDLAINLDNLKLSLAGINLETDGDVNINPKSIDIESCLFRINIDDVFLLMDYVPGTIAEDIKLPEGLTGELPIEVTLALTEPYQINLSQFDQFSLEILPPIEAMLKIEDANLQFQPGKSKKIEANDVYMVTECYYNPKEPETSRLILRELRMNGEGINLTGEAEVSNLTGEKQDISGKFAFSSPLMETLRYFLPSGGMNVRGFLKGDVKVDAVALNLGKDGMENISVSGDLSSHDLRVKPAKGTDLRLRNMHSGFAARIPAYPLKDYDGSRIGFTLKADTVVTDYGKFEARLTGISLDMEGLDSVSGSPQPDADIKLKIKNVNFSGPGNKLRANDIELSATGNLTATSYSNVASIPATTPGNDAIIASRAEHTPLVLEYEGGGLLQTIMGMASIRSDVKVAQCSYESSEYLYPIEIEVLDLFTNLNKIQLKAKKIEAGNTGFAMNCDVDGLGAFLTSYAPTPLKIATDINFSNVDIN